jgi:hydroxymethylpyrimidine/phosphomethylpyrimidine kinase
LTVQDNNRVHEVLPVGPDVVARQARAIAAACRIGAVKIGIPGSADNARAIADVILELREANADLPVVLDPVLASGQGDSLARGNAVEALAPLLALATVVTPNGPEAAALARGHEHRMPPATDIPALAHAHVLRSLGCKHVLVTGGHGGAGDIVNRWLGPDRQQNWQWPRLHGEFHGSGCTLAAAIAALLAQGRAMPQALAQAQAYTHRALEASFAIAPGQRIPHR